MTSIDAVSIEAPSFTRVDNMHFSQSASSSQSSFNQKRELYKCYVQRLLNAMPSHHSMPNSFRYFREHISHKWKLTDEPTKSVFRQLAREGRGGCNDARGKNQPSPSKKFHLPDEDSLIHCPIVHNTGRPNKRRKCSSSVARSSFQGAKENERSKVGGCSSSSTAKPPVLVLVKLTGILSLIDKEDEIDDGELRRFLSELDWARLYEGDET